MREHIGVRRNAVSESRCYVKGQFLYNGSLYEMRVNFAQ